MSPVFHYRKITNYNLVKVDRWFSLVFIPEKNICKDTKRAYLCLYVPITNVLYESMKSLWNEVNDLFGNTHSVIQSLNITAAAVIEIYIFIYEWM